MDTTIRYASRKVQCKGCDELIVKGQPMIQGKIILIPYSYYYWHTNCYETQCLLWYQLNPYDPDIIFTDLEQEQNWTQFIIGIK